MICLTSLAIAWLSCLPHGGVGAAATDITLAPGASIQAAIDAAAPGTVIRLAEGVYPERIKITKPLTLIGAGWDKTVVGPEGVRRPTKANDARAHTSGPGIWRALGLHLPPTITVRNARDVELRGLRVRGPDSSADNGALSDEALIVFDSAAVVMSECAVVGPSMNGISICGASDVRLAHSLVAALWGTGVQASGSRGSSTRARVEIADCDIRNCYYCCVSIAADDAVVERCRISGAAWHGIRYGSSATIRENYIFGNARSGIYADGETAAKVTGNVFWRNEIDGISCWFKNGDSIEGNTFVGNLREGIAVLGGSRPKISKNVFANHPIAVYAGSISCDSDPGVIVPGELALIGNFFWANAVGLKIADQALSLPFGNEIDDVGFVDAAAADFTLSPESVARRNGAGASDPIPFASPFPILSEEKAMIPETDSRDFKLWKR